TPRGATAGDLLLLTKGVPIEATAIIAREFSQQLKEVLSQEALDQAQNFLYHPGISILPEARIALSSGRVTAMHDPTEGGLALALWERAEASQHAILFRPETIPITPLSARICQFFDLDPLGAIASGALLFTAPPGDALKIQQAIIAQAIPCIEIGAVEDGPAAVWQETPLGRTPYHRPARDEIAKLF
ncbi:MAG: AIR synthase-related protein, partial [Omnitrophica WOR_2 bacterium]